MNMHESVMSGTILKDAEIQDMEAPYGVQFSRNTANLFAKSIKKVKDTEAPHAYTLHLAPLSYPKA